MSILEANCFSWSLYGAVGGGFSNIMSQPSDGGTAPETPRRIVGRPRVRRVTRPHCRGRAVIVGPPLFCISFPLRHRTRVPQPSPYRLYHHFPIKGFELLPPGQARPVISFSGRSSQQSRDGLSDLDFGIEPRLLLPA